MTMTRATHRIPKIFNDYSYGSLKRSTRADATSVFTSDTAAIDVQVNAANSHRGFVVTK